MMRRAREPFPPPACATALALAVLAAGFVGCGPQEVAEAPPVVRPIKMMEVGAAVSGIARAWPRPSPPASAPWSWPTSSIEPA